LKKDFNGWSVFVFILFVILAILGVAAVICKACEKETPKV